MPEVFAVGGEVPKRKKKARVTDRSMTEDEYKREALLEINSNRSIRQYFGILISEYNKNILELTRPKVIDEKRDVILDFNAKKDLLVRILRIAKEESERGVSDTV